MREKVSQDMQGHVAVTHGSAISVAEDTRGLFLTHSTSTTVRGEVLQCQP